MTYASDIKVDKLRTVFFWPLVLDFGDKGGRHKRKKRHLSPADVLNDQFEALVARTPWTPVTDTLKHLGHDESVQDAYGEYVYFHDFLQKTLFGSRSDPRDNHPLLLLKRTDVTEIDVTFQHGSFESKPAYKCMPLSVERLNLYLLRPGIVVLALQVSTREPHDLAALLRLNDVMRRSHLPFYEPWGTPASSRPTIVTFRQGNERTISFSTGKDIGTPRQPSGGDDDLTINKPVPTVAERLLDMEPQERRLLPYRHWRWLITDGEDDVFPFESKTHHNACWRHFSDERLPILATYVLDSRDDYYNIDEGNWSRLTFVDPPGSDPTPYAAEFLRAQMPDHCYDRYHHAQDAEADAPVRYLMCDYALTTVTYRNDTRPEKWWQGDPTNGYASVIETHMQRHYYQMFLLAVIDKSVMLSISSRISSAVEVFDKARSQRVTEAIAEDQLMDAMEDINKDFLHYVHRFRFTGISGQLQPSEMYAKLRAVMGLDTLFSDIRTELDTAVAFLSGRSEKRGAEATERLGVVATLALVLGLVMAFFSMNIITDKDVLFPSNDDTAPWAFGLKYLFVTLSGFIGTDALSSSGASLDHWTLGWKYLLTAMGGFSLLIGTMVTIMSYLKTENLLEGRLYPRITQVFLIGLGVLCLYLGRIVL